MLVRMHGGFTYDDPERWYVHGRVSTDILCDTGICVSQPTQDDDQGDATIQHPAGGSMTQVMKRILGSLLCTLRKLNESLLAFFVHSGKPCGTTFDTGPRWCREQG
jgi:hypothetical protein